MNSIDTDQIGGMNVTDYWIYKSQRVVDDPEALSYLWQECCKVWSLQVKREAIRKQGLIRNNNQSSPSLATFY